MLSNEIGKKLETLSTAYPAGLVFDRLSSPRFRSRSRLRLRGYCGNLPALESSPRRQQRSNRRLAAERRDEVNLDFLAATLPAEDEQRSLAYP